MPENSSEAPAILNVEGLSVSYRLEGRWFEVLRDLYLRIRACEICGLVGESGSGKTTLALAILRYLGPNGMVTAGKIELVGQNLLALDLKAMRGIWGKRLTLVPQNPQSSLNPSLRLGDQLAELLIQHEGMDADLARREAVHWFERVKLADPQRVAASFPHQVSGGMQQRVLIAMALCTGPQLLILDEPTTGLDVTTQADILDLVRDLIGECGTAALYVTHNLAVVAELCHTVSVLYAGELVETARPQDLLARPLHPYTRGLIDSVPRLGETKAEVQLRAIQGHTPALGEILGGCSFRPRCPVAIEICETRPTLSPSGPGRWARCFRWEELESGGLDASQPGAEAELKSETSQVPPREPVLKIDRLEVCFPVPRFLSRSAGKRAGAIHAVHRASLQVERGQTFGLVGESGSGKTSLARAVMGLIEITDGEVRLLDIPLPPDLRRRDLKTLRRLQMVIQNPEEALNPYLTVGETLRRPLISLLGYTRGEADSQVPRLLEQVDLSPEFASRFPNQLSGGQIQRVAIARALASNPDLLICDEPVSALDVSVQAAISNLLSGLQRDNQTSLLFISHNLALVAYLADEIGVMYLGRLMEISPAAEIFKLPHHPYTEALLASIPNLESQQGGARIHLQGETPSLQEIPSGCPFHTRCPRFLGDVCIREIPLWRVVAENGKRYFCHIPEEELRAIQQRSPRLVSNPIGSPNGRSKAE